MMRGKELDNTERTAVKYRNQEEHGMSRMKGLAAILGVAVLMVVIAACGNGSKPTSQPTSLSDEVPTPVTPTVGGTNPMESNPPTTTIVSHDGPAKDYVSLVDNLRAAGATVDPAGTVSADYFAPQGQVLTVNGGRVETFEFASAEEANAVAEGVTASGSSITRVDSETGESVATSVLWVAPPHFYKAGKLIVLYVGSDSDVINVLQETLGPQFAGGASLEAPNSPIEFVMEDTYALGQDIEIKIRNNGTNSYVYSEYYPACRNLEFYDGSQEARQLERLSGSVELPPGLFIVPEGTHCDIANESQIKPGEEVVLLVWGQHECVKDKWGCVEDIQVKAGKYTIVGEFPESKGSIGPDAPAFREVSSKSV